MSVACAALSVTARVPAAPWATWSVAGSSRVSVGPAGRTVTTLWSVLPFTVAVIVAVPGERAVIVTVVVTVPAEMVTDVGTDAIEESLLCRSIVVGPACAVLMVAVRVPVPPWVTGRVGAPAGPA